jgi:hypothetical protein
MAFETGKAKLHDLPCSGCPFTAVWPEVLLHDYAIVREDGCITTRQLAFSISISKGSVIHTRCVSQSLTVTRKTKRKVVSYALLVCFQAQGETFPSWVTVYETWFHHFELETERQSVEWCYCHFPQKK